MPTIEIIPAKPKEARVIRVAAYARVSVEKDASFHSLEAQNQYYKDYVERHPGWVLVDTYSDNGISGTTVDRPEFQRMLQDCRGGKIDLVITKSITRFARNTVILLQSVRELKSLGIDCYFEKENMHSISPDGELVLTLLAMYAEEEARSASENQRWRIQKKFKKGEPWSIRMLGYHLVNGILAIIPEEAEIVKEIFSDYLSGMGRQSIANKCAQKYGLSPFPIIKVWNNGTIANILRNECYVGDIILQKTFCEDFRVKRSKINRGERRRYFIENDHEAIIDRNTFNAVQKELERRRLIYKANCSNSEPKKSNPFKGIVFCGICGAHSYRKQKTGKSSKEYVWICNTRHRYGKSRCPSMPIPENILTDITKAVLQKDEITCDVLSERLDKVVIEEHRRLLFVFKDGSSKEVNWQYPPRSASWTPEMRRQAAERAKNQGRRKKDE